MNATALQAARPILRSNNSIARRQLEILRFTIGKCSLGSILVAASEKGVCCVTLGEDPDYLMADLQTRFPHAELVVGDHQIAERVARVVEMVEAPGPIQNLPLDLRGTAFQQRVWHALSEIPCGTTASYSDIARKIGSPQAVRAVAGACAMNPIAVIIPCHRVVRTNGSLAGYRWGTERKRALLHREACL